MIYLPLNEEAHLHVAHPAAPLLHYWRIGYEPTKHIHQRPNGPLGSFVVAWMTHHHIRNHRNMSRFFYVYTTCDFLDGIDADTASTNICTPRSIVPGSPLIQRPTVFDTFLSHGKTGPVRHEWDTIVQYNRQEWVAYAQKYGIVLPAKKPITHFDADMAY